MSPNETADDPLPFFGPRTPTPGLLLVWTSGAPTCRAFPFATGGHALQIGRERGDIVLADDKTSGRHASLIVEGTELIIRDLGSRNGTFINGERIQSAHRRALPRAPHGASPAHGHAHALPSAHAPHVLRIGGSVFLIEPDVTRFEGLSDLRVPAAAFAPPPATSSHAHREPQARATGPSAAFALPELGDSVAGPELRRVWAATTEAAANARLVLVRGESGTGKERIARLFHARGPRARARFVDVNCGNLKPERADADLFGATRGAYTGADQNRLGHFEEADGGVLFLDEVGDLPFDTQVQLLRVLETGVIRPLGGTPHKVDVAIVMATHRDLDARVAEGRFRQDLLMRLGERIIDLPPLRARPEEIPFLVDLVMTAGAPRAGLGWPAPTARFIEACLLDPWPGNARELTRRIGRAATQAALASAPALEPDPQLFSSVPAHLPVEMQSLPPPGFSGSAPAAPTASPPMSDDDRTLLATLDANGGDVSKTARTLGIARGTVYNHLRRLGLAPR